jgi:hypothetical protein
VVNKLQPIAGAAPADFVPGDVGGSARRGRMSRSESFARLSYTQNAEDVVMSRTFADQEFGFSVDISACHPVEEGVTLHFYHAAGRARMSSPTASCLPCFWRPPARHQFVHRRWAARGVGLHSIRRARHPTGTRGHGTFDATLTSARCAGGPNVCRRCC